MQKTEKSISHEILILMVSYIQIFLCKKLDDIFSYYFQIRGIIEFPIKNAY